MAYDRAIANTCLVEVVSHQLGHQRLEHRHRRGRWEGWGRHLQPGRWLSASPRAAWTAPIGNTPAGGQAIAERVAGVQLGVGGRGVGHRSWV